MSRILLVILLATGLLWTALFFNNALAHHSRSNYDMQTFLEYDGVVVEFAWKNPHAFAVIEIEDENGNLKRLLLEMNSKPILTGMGWTDDALQVGDKIHVRGNPDRRADRKQLFVAYIVNRDGRKLWSFGRTRDEAERYAQENPVERKPLIGSTDFSGIWNRARLSNSERRRRPDPFSPADLPVTEKGEAARKDFDRNDDPSFECLPNTLPQTIVPVYPMEIAWANESLLTFHYEFNNGRREVHMEQTEFPSEQTPTRLGFSIGALQDGVLEIHTRYFSYDRWGNGRGVPSGEQKEVLERYTLTNDGKRLEVSYSVSDPEYLSGAPIASKGAYVLRNNIELSDFDCDPKAATRHLTGE
jgi:hypothetical protein